MLHHLVDRATWDAAVAAGRYTGSTRGAEVADVGFVHLAMEDQLAGVVDRFYADVRDELVVLSVDETRLTAPVVFERPPGAKDAFPHLYGELPLTAVVAARDVAAFRC